MYKPIYLTGDKPIVLCVFVKSVFPVCKSYCSTSKILSLSDMKVKIEKTYAITNVFDLYRFRCEPFCRLSFSLYNWSPSQGCSQDKSFRLLFLKEQAHTLITFKICFPSITDVWQKALNSEHIVTGLNKWNSLSTYYLPKIPRVLKQGTFMAVSNKVSSRQCPLILNLPNGICSKYLGKWCFGE